MLMQERRSSAHSTAAVLEAAAFGILAGLGAMTHGIGEVLQGSVAPDGLIINSWTQGPIAANLGGEPAMTIVPNLSVTGIVTILLSIAMVVWSIAFVRRRKGGLILLLLSVAVLLTGGGFAPPVIGILAGAAGTGAGGRYSWWRAHLSPGVRAFLARLWPWLFGLCLGTGVFLAVGSVFLVYAFGLNNPDLFSNSFLLAVVLLLLTIVTGVAYDIGKGPHQ
jgi:hypothetical protein